MQQLEAVFVEQTAEQAAVVHFTGEHDLATRTEVQELLQTLVMDNDLVVADVTDAQFIDSSLLSALFVANATARDRGSRFRLQLGTAAIVRRALEVSGVLEGIECVSSREEALRDAG